MRLFQTMAYAVHAMFLLARVEGDGPVPCSQLADEGQIPARFLLRVFSSLANHGLLNSAHGVEGGFTLARPAEEILLVEIFDAVETSSHPSVLPLRGIPEEPRQALLDVLSTAYSASREQLENVSLADLLGIGSPFSDDLSNREYLPKI